MFPPVRHISTIIWIIFSKKNAFFLDESNVFLCVSDFFQFIFVLLTINMQAKIEFWPVSGLTRRVHL